MGLNSSPKEIQKPEFPSPVYIREDGGGNCFRTIFMTSILVGFFSMFIFAAYLMDQDQQKYDNFVGKKVVIKLSGMEGFIDESPTMHGLTFNNSHWGVKYVDKSGNTQRVYCTNDEIELKD